MLIPKYYDPSIVDDLASLQDAFELVTVQELVDRGALNITAGVEVGKMAYGAGGDVPFVRTSDLSDWELKSSPKQRVTQALYDQLRNRADVQTDDVLIVSDGTYLVGTSAMVTSHDSNMLYSAGLRKLRALDHAYLDPNLLLALLNLPIVKRQIQAKRFTRDIIDMLGRRLYELVLPIPKDGTRRSEIAHLVRGAVQERGALRERAKAIAVGLEGAEELGEGELEILAMELP